MRISEHPKNVVCLDSFRKSGRRTNKSYCGDVKSSHPKQRISSLADVPDIWCQPRLTPGSASIRSPAGHRPQQSKIVQILSHYPSILSLLPNATKTILCQKSLDQNHTLNVFPLILKTQLKLLKLPKIRPKKKLKLIIETNAIHTTNSSEI